MPGYVNCALHQFNHVKTKKPYHQPYSSLQRAYVTDVQNIKLIDTSPVVSADTAKRINIIVGKFLYYACGVGKTCLVLLSAMASRIYPTEKDENNVNQFSYYMATHPDAVVRSRFSHYLTRQHICVVYD